MRTKYCLLPFLLIIILVYCTTVQAATDSYSLGVKKGDEVILEVKTCEKDRLDEVYGDAVWEDVIPEGADIVGMKSKIVVNEIDDEDKINLGILGNYDAFSFKADNWEWTTESFKEEPDDDEYEEIWFQDPKDINDAYSPIRGYSGEIPFIPLPVGDFLDSVEWKEGWEAEDNKIVHEAKIEDDYIETYTYDTNTGFLIGFKIEDEKKTVIYEYGQSTTILGYEIPLVLGLIAVFIFGIVCVLKKKLNIV